MGTDSLSFRGQFGFARVKDRDKAEAGISGFLSLP
jgi:hypothetical protein